MILLIHSLVKQNSQIVLAHSAMPPSALLRPKQLRLRSGSGTGSRLQRSAQRTTKLVVAVSAQQTLLFCNKIQLRYFVCTYLLGRKAFLHFSCRSCEFLFCFLFFAKKEFRISKSSCETIQSIVGNAGCNLM
jgi:hypothetical protein